MKNYTDLEQSEKLVEFLPLESADMCYPLPCNDGDKPLLEQGGFGSTPCWSLAALIAVLPRRTSLLKSAIDDTYNCICPNYIVDKWFDNPIDACYELILKLHENKLLLNK